MWMSSVFMRKLLWFGMRCHLFSTSAHSSDQIVLYRSESNSNTHQPINQPTNEMKWLQVHNGIYGTYKHTHTANSTNFKFNLNERPQKKKNTNELYVVHGCFFFGLLKYPLEKFECRQAWMVLVTNLNFSSSYWAPCICVTVSTFRWFFACATEHKRNSCVNFLSAIISHTMNHFRCIYSDGKGKYTEYG